MSKKSFDKKKQREKKSHQKVLARRTVLRTKAKEERDQERERLEMCKVTNRIEGRTIVNSRDDEEVLDQLQHNLEILEVLQKEQEMIEEAQKNATPVNTENTPQPGSLTSSADVVFIPNLESNEEKEKDEEQ